MLHTAKEHMFMVGKRKTVFSVLVLALCILSLLALSACLSETVKITFDTDGGSYVRTVSIPADATEFTMPENPTKKGYQFDGWFIDEERTEPFNERVIPTESLTVYARWTADEITVTFMAKLPSETSYWTGTVSISSGSSLSGLMPTVPEKAGYVGEWDTDGKNITSVVSAMTIYARYTKVENTLTFVTANNTENIVIKKYMGDSYDLPDPGEYAGYEFAGWYADAGYATVFSYSGSFPGQNMTVYARWLKKSDLATYFISELADGGTAVRLTGFTRTATYRNELFIPSEIGGLPVKYVGFDDGTASSFSSSRLITLTVAASVELIGDYAFANNSALKTVGFIDGSKLKKVGEGAFFGCHQLTAIALPDSVVELGSKAFSGEALENEIMMLSSFKLGSASKLSILGESVFDGCDLLRTFPIPNTLLSIDYKSFIGSAVSAFTASPSHPTLQVYNGAVYSKDGTSLLYFPNNGGTATGTNDNGTTYSYSVASGLLSIAPNAFRNSKNLVSLALPRTLVSIGEYAFAGISLERVAFPTIEGEESQLASIGAYAFYEVRNIETLSFSNSLISIGEYAFAEMTGLSSIVLGEELASIGDGGFMNCSELLSIELPASLLKINDYTFYGCEKLRPTFAQASGEAGEENGTALSEIGQYAFYGCIAITELTVPGLVTTVGDYAFSVDSAATVKMSLRLIDFQERVVEKIGKSAFENCTSLVSFSSSNLSSRLKYLGERAFANCTLLQSATFSTSITALTSIEPYTFYNCVSLASDIILPSSVKNIGDYAFYNCVLLKNVFSGNRNATPTVEAVGKSAFENCRSLQANAADSQRVIFSSIKTLGERAFYACATLDRVYLPSALTSVGDAAFGNCTAIYDVQSAGECALTSLSKDMFINCTSLASFTVPKRVQNLSGNPFGGCTSLLFINADANNNYFSSETGECNGINISILYQKNLPIIALFPTGYSLDYQVAENITGIADYAFYNSGITALSFAISDKNVAIGEYAFAECSKLTQAVLSSRVVSVGSHAFQNTPVLSSVTISESGEPLSIGDYAFAKSKLASITIPSRITAIGDYAFSGNFSLTSASFSSGGGSDLVIGDYAFYQNHGISVLNLPDRLVSVGDYAFAWCVGLTSVSWGGGSSDLVIGSHAFENCHMLTDLTLSSRITEIGSYAFAYASRLDSLFLDGNDLSTGENVFFGANKLKNVGVSANINKLGDGMFYGNISLAEVTYEARTNALEIGDYTFYGCTSLTQAVLDDRLTSVGISAFENSGISALVYGSAVAADIALGDRAFANTKISDIVITSRLSAFGKEVFADNGNVKSLTFAEDFTTDLGESMFENMRGAASYGITLPGGVKSIGKHSFKNITALTSFTFAEHSLLESIGDYSFYGCLALKGISVPENVTYIGEYSFFGCRQLSSVTVDADVAYTLGNFAFADCYELTRLDLQMVSCIYGTPAYGSSKLALVTVSESNPHYKASNGVLYSKNVEIDGKVYGDSELLVCYPAGRTGSVYSIVKRARYVADYAFSGNAYLTNIVITAGDLVDGNPETPVVLQIAEHSFTSLNPSLNIFLSNTNAALSVETLELAYKINGVWQEYASNIFNSTDTYEDFIIEIIVGDEISCRILSYIGTATTSLVIPANLKGLRVKEIGAQAFKDNNILRRIELPSSLISVGERAFENCSVLQSIVISDSVIDLGSNCFFNCTSLTTVTFGSASVLSSISRYAFYGCTALVEITIPSRVTAIGMYAFAGTVEQTMALETVNFAENSSLLSIANNAFQYCTRLSSITLPEKVNKLGAQVFFGCSYLTNVIVDRPATDGIISLENDRVFQGTPSELIIYVDRVALQEYLKARYWKEISAQINEKEKVFGDYSVEDASGSYTVSVITSYLGIYDSVNHSYDRSRENEFLTNTPEFISNVPVAKLDTAARTFTQIINGTQYTLSYTSSYTLQSQVSVNIPIPSGSNTYTHTVRVDTLRMDIDGVRILKYLGGAESLTVPETINDKRVLRMGSYSINSKVKSLTLPHGLLSLDSNAFSYATSLTSVILPLTLTAIGDHAFDGTQLSSLTFGSANNALIAWSMLDSIGAYAFYNSIDFGDRTLAIPPRVSNIGSYAFAGDVGSLMRLKNISFTGETMNKIGSYAFANTAVESISLPAKLSVLGEGAFNNCENLTTVYIDSPSEGAAKIITLENSSAKTFEGCHYVKIYVPSSLLPSTSGNRNATNDYTIAWAVASQRLEDRIYASSSIYTLDNDGGYVSIKIISDTLKTAELIQFFGKADAVIPEYIDGYRITIVSAYAFGNAVTTVTLPDSVVTISSYAFYRSSVERVLFTAGSKLSEIGLYAFYGSMLKAIEIPFSVHTIMQSAFEASQLSNLSFAKNDELNDATEEGLSVRIGAFRNTQLVEVYMPRRLTELDDYAFADNKELQNIYFISAAVIDEIRANNYDPSSIVSASALKKIGQNAFENNTGMTVLYLPYSLEAIGALAFNNCTSLQLLYMLRGRFGDGETGSTSVPTLDSGAFNNVNNSLFKIIVPRNSVELYRAAENWKNYAAYAAGNPDYIIGNQRYGDFGYIIADGGITLTKYFGTEKSLVIPDKITVGAVTYSVKTIGAYFGTDTLEYVVMTQNTDTAQTLAAYAFAYSKNLARVDLPSSVETIESYAFYNCVKLERINIPSSVRIISSYTFAGCVSLQEIRLPNSVTNINDNAFNGCERLYRLVIEKQSSGSLLVEPGAAMLSGTSSYLKIFVDVNSLSAYKGKTGWTAYQSQMYAADCLYGDYAIDVNSGNEVTVLQYIGSSTEISVPETMRGGKVVAISEFAISPSVEKIILHEGVTYKSDIEDKVEII